MRKLMTTILFIVLVTSSLVGCGNTKNKNAEDKAISTTNVDEAENKIENKENLVVTYVVSPLNAPSIIEKNKEVFKTSFADLGVSVEYAEINSGADQTQALASKDVQILNAVGATSVVLSAANNADIKILSMYSRSPKAFAIYSNDDTINSPEDLKGKTIAGPAGTNLHELLASYLASGGLTIDDVNYVNMTIPDAKAGLDGKSVDVALLAGATVYTAKQQGQHLVTDGEGYIDAIIAVAVTQEFYDSNPGIINAFKKAQTEIATYMAENEDEVISIVATELDLDEEAVREMYEYYNFSTEISDADIAGLQKTADFMFESEMIETELDVNTLFLK